MIRTGFMRYGLFVLVVFAGTSLTAQGRTTYSVYCANSRIEIDSRTLEQMKSARGSDVCRFGEFDYLSDAQSFAQKNFGGAGTSCSCR